MILATEPPTGAERVYVLSPREHLGNAQHQLATALRAASGEPLTVETADAIARALVAARRELRHVEAFVVGAEALSG